ncbi:diamine acetyltransferase [Streptomyces sp. NBRC 110611]|nr:diamine acetyltransferase [Streptomyces sp. NBRC 110611]
MLFWPASLGFPHGHLAPLGEDHPGNFDAAIALKVRPDQDHLVAPVVKSLAEAYVHPGIAWPRLIFDRDRLVGFLMAFLDIDFAGDGTGRPGNKAEAMAASRSRRSPPRSAAVVVPA